MVRVVMSRLGSDRRRDILIVVKTGKISEMGRHAKKPLSPFPTYNLHT